MAGSSVYKRGKHLIQGEAIGASSLTSDPVIIEDCDLIGIHLVSSASGDRAGSVTVQISNDASNWVNVTFDSGATSVTVVASTLLNAFVNLSSLAAQWLRVVYTRSSGTTGTLDCYVVLKGRS